MSSASSQRVIMFLLGASTQLPAMISSRPFFASQTINLINVAVSGVIALLTYEVMFRSKKWLRLYTLPIYWIVGLIIYRLGGFFSAPILITHTLTLPSARSLQTLLELKSWWTFYYYTDASSYTIILQPLINVALFVVIAYILLQLSKATIAVSEASGLSVSMERSGVLSGGYGGIEMDTTKSQTTRFLSASALLLGESFRSRVLNHVKDKYRAVAPELGLDLGLLVRVCKFIDNREIMYRYFFVFLGVVAVLVGFASLGAALAVFMLGAWGLQGYKSYEEQRRLSQYFSKARYDPDVVANKFTAYLDAELASGIPEDGQNIIVFEGFSPFVGAGIDLGGWSFAVDLSHPKKQLGKEEEPIPFEASELNASIKEAINSLGFEGAVVKDCLFVNGVDVREDNTILPNMLGRPTQQVAPETLNQYMKRIDTRVRHYKWIRVYDWGNELVISHFLRCVLKGENLFVEISRFLLTPLDTKYRQIDALTSKTWWDAVGLFMTALVVGPFAALFAWLALLVKMGKFISSRLGFEDRRRRREIKSNPLYDYGVALSIRESVSSPRFVHYFQRLDREMYVKILEREILDTIVEFLDDHNIDTSEIKDRQTTIMNQGIIVQGGDVEAQSLAVGAGAQAIASQKFEAKGREKAS
jgi:hypothetical protein